MELPISYYPILHIPSVKPGGIGILKKSGHNTQKWAIIGKNGKLYCYRYDNKILGLRFVAQMDSQKSEVILAHNDEFIVSQNSELYTFTRTGEKKKLANSPFENEISHMIFDSGQIVACSGALCSYVKPNAVPDTLPAPIVGMAQLGRLLYLGCSDGTVHSFIGGRSHLVYHLPAAVTCIKTAVRTSMQSYLAVGCADTILRFYNVNDQEVSQIKLGSSVIAMASCDFDRDGFCELLVALEDSTVCLLNLALIDSPKLMSSLLLGFNASNIEIGIVYASDMATAIVTSQTGQTGLLFIEPKSDRSLLSGRAPKVTEEEIAELKARVDALEITNPSVGNADSGPVSAQMEVKGEAVTQRFLLLAESEKPIVRAAISCTIPLRLYSRGDCQSIITVSPDSDGKSAVITPMDSGLGRLAVDFSYDVGLGGELSCFLLFAKSDSVFSKVFTLRPFGLLKTVDFNPFVGMTDDMLAILEVNASESSGFHEVLDQCLPDLFQNDEPKVFQSGPIGSMISVAVQGERFVAKSIFFPIIVEFRSFILKAMNEKKQKLAFETRLGDKCLSTFFDYIKGDMLPVLVAGKQYYRLQALQEVRNSAPATEFGDDETVRILHDALTIERNFEVVRTRYEAYVNEIAVFYTEMWKKSNIDTSRRLNDIINTLKDVSDDKGVKALVELMKASPK